MKLLRKICAVFVVVFASFGSVSFASETVTVDNFVRAETDVTLWRYVKQGAFARIFHIRQPVPLDKQDVIRMNRDTLYSAAVFDLSSPVTISKPDSAARFQSMLVISQDHSMIEVEHGPGKFTLTEKEVGTRYVMALFRTFVNANDPADIKAANAMQDQIGFEQADAGEFKIPEWDMESLSKVRAAINVLGATLEDTSNVFGKREDLNPINHLIGTAFGWGGNPKEAAMYLNSNPENNDGIVPYSLTVKDVPVHGFWSITTYNSKGYMEKNDLDAYSFNNVTAETDQDGSITINFGDCDDGRVNCLPVKNGWNYIVRLYQPMDALLEGKWIFPEAEPVL